MQFTPDPDTEPGTVPGRRSLAGLVLVPMAVLIGNLLLVPDVAAALLGLAGIAVLPVLVAVAVGRVVAMTLPPGRPVPDRPWRIPGFGTEPAVTDDAN